MSSDPILGGGGGAGGGGGGGSGAGGADDAFLLFTDPFASGSNDAGDAAFASAGAGSGAGASSTSTAANVSGGGGGGGNKGKQRAAAPPTSAPADNPFLLGTGSGAAASAAAAAGAASAKAQDYVFPTDPEQLKRELQQARERTLKLEMEIAEKDAKAKKMMTAIEHYSWRETKNWPFRAIGILHHDIKGDIATAQRQRLMRGMYLLWIVSSVMLLWTFIVICACWFSGVAEHVVKDYWISFVMGILGVGVGVPLSFLLWYWSFYGRFSKEKIGSGFWVPLFNLAMHALYALYNVLGFYHGTAGAVVASALNKFTHTSGCLNCCNAYGLCGTTHTIFILFISATLAWSLNLVFTVFMFYKMFRYYRANCSDSPQDVATVVPILVGLGL